MAYLTPFVLHYFTSSLAGRRKFYWVIYLFVLLRHRIANFSTREGDWQVIHSALFDQFKNNCITLNAYNSIANFWAARQVLFPNLIFCERVFQQRLDQFAGKWNNGVFDFKNLGLDCSPDTPNRIANTLALRTFDCPLDFNWTPLPPSRATFPPTAKECRWPSPLWRKKTEL